MSEHAEFCPRCGGLIVYADEIAAGSNGALSDEGTGRTLRVCEECGYVAEPES